MDRSSRRFSFPDWLTVRGSSSRHLWGRVALLLAVFATTVLLGVNAPPSVTQQVMAHVQRLHLPMLTASAPAPADSTRAPETINLRKLSAHPSAMHQPYLAPTVFSPSEAEAPLLHQFHELLDVYVKRQGVDDNFTIRVFDSRTHEVLEVYEMPELRDRLAGRASIDWRAVDQERRRATGRLVDKWVDRGIPREDVMVRWGRANQIRDAHGRGAPYREYEVRLAQYLDLSLLPIEVSTVETFNRDDLVSSVGARSRYQMMPWIMKRLGVNAYRLQTENGSWLHVREEWHPLLTMEPAFTLLRGYVNAVGHEIPGISAYHTGPGNIYTIYRLFFTESDHFTTSSTVTDAYLWGLTEGFETVREASSFGPYSRGYIPAAYGSLVATDHLPLDTRRTMRAARVQLQPGARLPLRSLLSTLDAASLDWSTAADAARSPYERFRALNPHLDLPPSPDGELPQGGNVRLVSSVDGTAVRFFVPLGAPEVLRQAGLDVLDRSATFRYDRSTYAEPSPSETSVWDRRYDALVASTRHFGFTPSNRERLIELYEAFAELADAHPESHYRQMQFRIIRTHKRIWTSDVWEKLSETAMHATGRVRMPVQAPVPLEAPSSLAPSSVED